MNKLINRIGYSNQLELKDKFAYVGAAIGLTQLFVFLVFFILVVKSALLIAETLTIMMVYLFVFACFKRKKFISGKSVAVLALIIHVSMLVWVWFPAETHFIFFYFLIPPISFFIFDSEILIERKILVFLNVLTAVLVLISVVINPLELIRLEQHYLVMLRVMSTCSTIVIETMGFFFYADSLAKTHSELKFQAHTDALTNVANRRMLFEQGEQLVGVFNQYGRPFTLMILDIDHFKQVNDQYGHPAGDAVLKEMSKLISENIRKDDLVCRYGGEEFAVLYQNTGQHQNIEKLKKKINAHRFTVNETTRLSITCSAGVVSCYAGMENFDALVKEADALLYQAKANGRNQIVFEGRTDALLQHPSRLIHNID